MKFWQAWYTTQLIEAGTRRDKTPRRTLVTLIMHAHTKTDAKAIAKAHPHLKFVEHDTDGDDAARERAAILRLLRSRQDQYRSDGHESIADALLQVIDRIEKGAHHRP
jgi:hypothetical protein